MCFEPEDALAWGERTHSSTVRTFHQVDGTFSKSFEIDGNQFSRKRAVGCFARVFLFFRRFHCARRVRHSVFRDRLLFELFSIHPRHISLVLILEESLGACSINKLERIMAQDQQFCGGLEPLGSD